MLRKLRLKQKWFSYQTITVVSNRTWRISKERSKLSIAKKCVRIRLASILQWQIRGWDEGRKTVRKEENFHKNVWELMTAKFEILTFSIVKSTIKDRYSTADRQQDPTDNSRAKSSWTSRGQFDITYWTSKTLSPDYFPSTLHANADWQLCNSKTETFNHWCPQPRYIFYGMWRYAVYWYDNLSLTDTNLIC